MMRILRLVFAVNLVSIVSFASPMLRSGFRFDSATQVAMDGFIPEITIRTIEKDENKIQAEITDQLFYLVGAFNEIHAAADLGHVQLKSLKTIPLENGGKEIRYSAEFTVAWAKNSTPPAKIAIALPVRADDDGRKAFFAAYGKTCASDPDLDWASFYYYIRPQSDGCGLLKNEGSTEVVTYSSMTIKPSNKQTEGKYPEYGKVWEDHKLVGTMIFGTDHPGATNNKDIGIRAYNEMYTRLWNLFGRPSWMNFNLGAKAAPGMRYPNIEMRWDVGGGRTVNVNILLIDKYGLQEPTKEFSDRYNERTKISDFVSYNGHSGFGDNIRALANMGTFEKGQYQLYLVNGCDTFFYVDDSLRAAHAAVNPGSTPYEFFDIITNGMPNPFSQLAMENALILQSLYQAKLTYREILSNFYAGQRSIVIGEEDNKWGM